MPTGAGSEHHRGEALATRLAVLGGAPGKALLGFPDLGEALFSHGQRLDQHGDVPQLRRHESQKFFVVYERLRHVAVILVDAALGEGPGGAEILSILTARDASHVGAGAAHAGHHEISHLESLHPGAHLHHLAERLMPQNQIIRSGGRRPVDEGADFPVGAADPHVERADPDLVRLGDDRRGMFHHPHFLAGRHHSHGAHVLTHVVLKCISPASRAAREFGREQ